MFFKIFKKIAGIIGYKLVDKDLVKNDRELANNSFYTLNKTLRYLFNKNLIKTLIQIGSNDGKRFDNLNEFIKEYSPKTILVEPIKRDFNELRKNYSNKKNIFFENSAISVNNKINTLFKVKEKKLKYYGEHVKGISSFNVNHLLKHGVSKFHIEKENVNSISINDLLKKYSIDQLDLLMLDTEGYDGDIIIDFLSTTSLKPLIIFEYIHIKQDTFKNLIKLLNIKKYQYFKIEENVICFPIDLNNEKKIFN
tara:strand:+ start:2438 stop:3193 length:756 start_codon:yes stop_codon:yes gene_type:complete